MNSFQNQNTQPIIQMEIFNNWNIVTKGWYIVCPSIKLANGKAKSFTICGQRIVIFRGEDGKVRALDAYCPHLGTDLGIGRVEGNFVRCFFHHWVFDGEGNCQHIPCQSALGKYMFYVNKLEPSIWSKDFDQVRKAVPSYNKNE
jgi:phenylpropionate dioxygenase-like ring-hydroxylating dioxygenase large terminal subunit